MRLVEEKLLAIPFTVHNHGVGHRKLILPNYRGIDKKEGRYPGKICGLIKKIGTYALSQLKKEEKAENEKVYYYFSECFSNVTQKFKRSFIRARGSTSNMIRKKIDLTVVVKKISIRYE